MKMVFRLATKDDISRLHNIRTAVKENVLSDPNRITPMDYQEKLEADGKGWICEVEGEIAGFAIVDMKNKNIWALFVHPKFERKGVGRALFTMMVDWAFDNGIDKLWLTTAPDTRADRLYASMDWQKTGLEKTGEVRFECTREMWQQFSLNPLKTI